MSTEEILSDLRTGKISIEGARKALLSFKDSIQHSPLDTLAPRRGPEGSSGGIAIVGMSGKYPDANNLMQYWDNLVQGKNAVREIPSSRFKVLDYYDPNPATPGKIYCKDLGAIDDIEYFDPLFFAISPAEAETMDPQHRLFLEEGYKAFEDAGYSPRLLSNRKCGVYLGIMSHEYDLLLYQQSAAEMNILGSSSAIAAARIAYLLNLKGPALAIDTACSSSLVATHLACQALSSQEIDMALIGGVSLYLTPESFISMCAAGMLSPDGQCKTFDSGANGFVPAEGVGALVLKRLADAEADHDQIYGVIIGSGMNQDGTTNGITAPSVKSQSELVREIYEKYQIDPASISYVEMHGTGTKLGDPMELEALAAVFQEKTPRKQYCAIGSVKSNIGHTSAAAGVASLQKVLLAMQHKKLVPTLHFQQPNEHFDFEVSPFYVNTKVQDWQTVAGRRLRAAVSSFGFSGTNAHLVIEEYLPSRGRARYHPGASPLPSSTETPSLFVLSAKSEHQLKSYAQEMKHWIQVHTELAPEDIAFTLQLGREAMEYRLAFVAASREVLLQRLEQFVDKQASTEVHMGQVKRSLVQYPKTDQWNSENLKSPPAQAPVRDSMLTMPNMSSDFTLGSEASPNSTSAPDHDAVSFEVYKDEQSLLYIWCQQKNLEQIAQAWVRGANIDWTLLYEEKLPQRISLPTYPFARERYWLPTRQMATPTRGTTAHGDNPTGYAPLHPLVQRNTSTLWEQRFSSTFRGDEFFLADHVVNGQRVLPGVAYLEMACAAIREAIGVTTEHELSYLHLSHVVWARPLAVGEQPVTVSITLSPQENGKLSFVISRDTTACTGSLEQAPTLQVPREEETTAPIYCQGTVALYTEKTASLVANHSLDLPTVQARCQQRISAAACYQHYRSLGLNYGPTFQGIEQLSRGEGEVLARFRLPAAVAQTCTAGGKSFPYVLHPSVLDSALHASIGLLIEQNTHLQLLVPFALSELSLHGALPTQGWTWIRWSPQCETGVASGLTPPIDVEVCDDAGRVVLSLRGLSGRQLPSAEMAQTLLLTPDWKEEAISGPGQDLSLRLAQEATIHARQVVLLCELPDIEASHLQAQLAEGGRCRSLHSSQLRRELRFQDIVVQLIQELQSLRQSQLAGVGKEVATGPAPTVPCLVQVVVAYREEPSLLEALLGVLKVAQQEYPILRVQLIEVDSNPSAAELLTWLHENQQRPHEPHIRYRDSKRWVREWQELPAATTPLKTPWKEGGCYLISGGSGGLARLFVQEIARHVQRATIILVGRSALSTAQGGIQIGDGGHWLPSTLQVPQAVDSGICIDYQQVDVSNGPAVHALMRRILKQYGHLDGIIHAAGMVRTTRFFDKTQEEVQAVLAPKVIGAELLDQESRELPLDFFLLCSSLSAVLGGVGYVDYAAANAYLDAFAHARQAQVLTGGRQGRTLAINWPYWEAGGMQMEAGEREMLRELLGEEPMGTEMGMKTLYQALVSDHAQIVVLHGQVERIKGQLLQRREPPVETAPELDKTPSYVTGEEQLVVTPMGQESLAQAERLQERASTYFKTQLASVIKLPVEQIDTQAFLLDYGFDSIMAMRFIKVLEPSFGPLSKTLLFEYPTLRNVTTYFLHNYPEQLKRVLGIEDAPVTVIPQATQPQIGAWYDSYQTSSSRPHSSFHHRLVQSPKTLWGMGAFGDTPNPARVASPPGPPIPTTSRVSALAFLQKADVGPGLAAVPPVGDIAIIGVAGRYPGARDLHEFWENLRTGKDCITEIPAERWDHRLYFDADKDKPGTTYSKWGGFLDGVDEFDPRFFNISPRDAERMDPQERLFLECAFATLEDAGYTRDSWDRAGGSSGEYQSNGLGGNVGVFVGVMYEEYQLYGAQAQIQGQPVALVGNPSSVANRVSHFCNFHGPSMAVDTACSSSLTAIHLACQSIEQRQCELALAGGVNVSLHPNKYLFLGQSKFVSSQGRCESFGQGADGYVPAEGVGAVLLKPLAQAEADGDHIYGVIKATAINHGGRTNGYTVPNPQAQADVIKQALKKARIDPRTISYIEAHGTGTVLGDPIEIVGLTRAFAQGPQDRVAHGRSVAQGTQATQWCAIGSVKSNIGHAESASGIAGITKVLLQMRYGQLVPSLHAQVLNPHIDFSTTPFVVQQELNEWKRPQLLAVDEDTSSTATGRGAPSMVPRRAGVSSFGAGGSNAHVILEEYRAKHHKSAVLKRRPSLIVLSARTQGQLQERVHQLLSWIQEYNQGDQPTSAEEDLDNLAYTLQVGREAMEERLALQVSSLTELEEKLQRYLAEPQAGGDWYRGQVKRHDLIGTFAADEDGQKTLTAWMSKGKYEKLLEWWVKGLTIDWKLLYTREAEQVQGNATDPLLIPTVLTLPSRISLATYPFARERYWLPIPKVEPTERLTSGLVSQVNDDVGLIAPPLRDWSTRQRPTAEQTRTMLLTPGWQEEALAKPVSAPSLRSSEQGRAPIKLLVLLCDFPGILASRIQAQMVGEGYCRSLLSSQTHRAQRFQDMVVQLIQELQHLWQSHPAEVTQEAGTSLTTVAPFLVQVVVAHREEPSLLEALLAVLKVAQQEYPKLRGQLIEVDGEPEVGALLAWLRENQHRPHEPHIRYRDGKRWVREWQEHPSATTPLKTPWKEGGCYLISGGSGSLARLFVQEIARHVQRATIILVGRSALSASQRAQLVGACVQGSSGGIRIDYQQVDVSDGPAVHALMQRVLMQYRHLNGIIHAAGVIRNTRVIDKTEGEVRAVLAPKVIGAELLDEASRAIALDFFLLCSSLSAVLGGTGYIDYAVANAYLDAFAYARQAQVLAGGRRGTTLSINWPYWEYGGMHVDVSTIQMMRELLGEEPMGTETGMETFYQALALGHAQVIVLHGQVERIKQQLLQRPDPAIGTTPVEIASNPDRQELGNKLHKALSHMVSQLLKVQIEQIDIEADLSEYGFDSVTFTQFASLLNQTYQLDLTPAHFYEYSTIERLAQYLQRTYAAILAPHFAVPVAPEVSPKYPFSDFTPPVVAEKGSAEGITLEKGITQIAIIGMSGCFPLAPDVQSLWSNLLKEQDCISEIPPSRWDWHAYYGDPATEVNKTNVKWAGIVEDVELFDPQFFGISPREAGQMDPQQRLLMMYVWKAIEDAGYSAESLSGSNTALFVGTASSGYNERLLQAGVAIEGYSATGLAPSVGPNRMSYFLNLHGPSEPIDTACSSSLIAIHRGVSAIESGQCTMAIVGGVSTLVSPERQISASKAGMLCEDGRCKTFSAQANGFVRGEGVGMLVLKKLSAAEQDNDHIYGIILATAENHGGRANSLTAPNPRAQADLLIAAYRKAGIDPRTVGYIEAHGTGTALGDPIEINGLKTAFHELAQTFGGEPLPQASCGLGSVKSNIGHLEWAAGVAGVIKVLLQMQHKQLVKSLHCEQINPYIQLEDSSFYIVQEKREWEPPRDREGSVLPRRAGISSFGFGGSNAHVVLEEYVPCAGQAQGIAATQDDGSVCGASSCHCRGNPLCLPCALIVLSARNEERLHEQVRQLLAWVQAETHAQDPSWLRDMAYTLQVGREPMEERLAFQVNSPQELEQKLNRYLQSPQESGDWYRGQLKHYKERVALLGDEEDLQEMIGKWLERGQYEKLLKLWVNGATLDWKLLYGVPLPHRISLPTYPFARERYWITLPAGATVRDTRKASSIGTVESVPSIDQTATKRVALRSLTEQSGSSTGAAEPSQKPRMQFQSPSQSLTGLRKDVGLPCLPKEEEYTPNTNGSSGNALVARSQARTPTATALEQGLVRSLAKALYMEESDIDVERPFVEIGLDSVIGVEWIQSLNKEYALNIKASGVYDYPTIRHMAGFLQEELQKNQQTPVPPTLTFLLDDGEASLEEDWPVQPSSPTQPPDPAPPSSGAHLESLPCMLPTRQEANGQGSVKGLVPSGRKAAIAIVGMAGKYPDAKNLTEYWANLVEGKNAIREIPLSRFDVSDYYEADLTQKGKIYCKWLGALDEIECFDPLFFHLSPADAESIDPQQRLFLEEGYRAFEDAGYSPASLSNRKCGVYLGIMSHEYALLLSQQKVWEANILGNSSAIGAARLAYLLNLKGPALAIDTACSSSLVATHLACQALWNQEIDMALAGGVTLYLTADSYVGMCSAGMLSPEGQCKTCDASANGFVPAEGVGAVVLKRLEDAEADHDQIYGVIIASGMNQDGATNGIMAPSMKSQAELEREIYEKFQIDPETISYVEMHGTGTKLGDPIELEALSSVFQEKTQRKQYCAVGSVKSNIGHTTAAAGMAGVHKVLLAIKHRKLVPTLHFQRPNEHFDFESSPFYVNTKVQDWKPTAGITLRAAVSSFGFSGTNAHLVIEEYVAGRDVGGGRREEAHESKPHPRASTQTPSLFVLSARSEQQLKRYAQDMKDWIQTHQELTLENIAFTLQLGREAMEYRLAIVADSQEILLQRLGRFADKQASTEIYMAHVKKGSNDATLFEQDRDGQSLLHIWCQKRNLQKLAQVWVRGVNVDWMLLYGEGSLPHRIGLPTYPFARERYWIPTQQAQPTASLVAAPVLTQAVLHPLVQQNISDFIAQRFSSTFCGNEFFLTDHVVKGQRIMPGVAYLEMVRAAVAQATRRTAQQEGLFLRLSHVVWTRPLTVSSSPVTVHITLSPQEDETIAFLITHESGQEPLLVSTEEETIYCQGQAVLDAGSDVPSLDLTAIQSRCPLQYSATQCYQHYHELGISYGPTMQGIEYLSVGDGEVLARLRLPVASATQMCVDGNKRNAASKSPQPYVLHPSMLDAALQAGIGLLLGQNTHHGPSIPFVLEELLLVGEIPAESWAWVCQRSASGTGSGLACDIEVCDNEGRVVVRLHGLSTRQFAIEEERHTLLLRPSWREDAIVRSSLSQRSPLSPEGKGLVPSLVLLCDLPGIEASHLQAQLSGGGRCCSLRSLQARREKRFQDAVVQLIQELQDLLRSRPTGLVLVQVVVAHRQQSSLLPALTGVLKTAQQEYPKLRTQMIEVEGEPQEKALLVWLRENRHRLHESHIRYRNGKRGVREWQEVNGGKPGPDVIPWKEGGCYLITGGTGGVARLFVQEIARQVQEATVILIGRSALSAERRAQLVVACGLAPQGENKGIHIDYQQVDVRDGLAVHALVQRVIEKSGHLDGIIHAAGELHDSLLPNKTPEEIQAVLAPKVIGVEHLDEASREVPLDFFVLCSSLAAVMGNLGQADYCGANAYLDAFAHARQAQVLAGERHGTTVSINWPLWEEGGMRMDASMIQMMRDLLGVEAMPTKTGMKVLYQALASRQAQVIVAHGQVERIKQRLLSRFESPMGAVPSESTANADHEYGQESRTVFMDKLRAALKQQVSRLLKVRVEEIDDQTPLSEYGFDSVSFTELANRLNQSYQLDLTPVLFFEHSTIERLARYLYKTSAAVLAPHFPATSPVVPALASEVEQKKVQAATPIARWRSRLAPCVSMQVSEHPMPVAATPIAIIGMSGVFPQARDIESLWSNLLAGKDCISEIPASRWDWQSYFGNPATEAKKTNIKWAGVIEGVEYFDPLFFGISPREAEQMDPQQRLLMMYVWKAIEDAGYSAESLSGTNTALFVGTGSSGYCERIFRTNMAIEGYSATGLAPSVGPNRISYFLNLHGPSEPIETACSSSLVAIHRAVNAIESGQCNMAIVGGINTLVSPEAHISFSKAGMLCEDGRCKAFSAAANGYVRGEGVGMLVLKKLSDAEQAGDHIYAVIRGSAENHGGRASSLTAPNPRAQADVLIAAYRKAGIDPRTVGYIEAHGTGTVLGDPIEIKGLKTAFSELAEQIGDAYSTNGSQVQMAQASCGIGTVKSNIGHLELAAGVAGVIKVLLQLHAKTLVKSLHCEQLNPYIELEGSPFYIVQQNREWEALRDHSGNPVPRRAGVSSFGFGGVNAHIVLEEYVPTAQAKPPGSEALSGPLGQAHLQLVVLSAKNEERLREQVRQLLVWVQAISIPSNGLGKDIGSRYFPRGEVYTPNPNESSGNALDDLAYTLQVGREAMEERLALQVSSLAQLEEKLRRYLEGLQEEGDWYRGQAKRHDPIAAFAADEDGQKVITAWISKGKYEKLLEWWVKGLTIDWKLLYIREAEQAQDKETRKGDSRTGIAPNSFSTPATSLLPRRISLPTYPFARESYWIPAYHLDSASQTQPVMPTIHQPAISEYPRPLSSQHGDVAHPEEILAFTRSYFVSILSTVLKISPEKLDAQVGFDEYGLDSIIVHRLHQSIEEVFGPIPATTFFQYKCISDLAHYFLTEHEQTMRTLFEQRSQSQSLQPAVQSLDQLQKVSASATERQKPITVVASPVEIRSEPHLITALEQDIAIIGISGQYPQANDLDAFWSNLVSGRDCIVEIPKERWDYQRYYQPQNGASRKTGGMYCKWGGFLQDIDLFDPSYFHISPLEARFMDPQERLFLQTVSACFEDAGYSKQRLRDERAGDHRASVGVFAGVTYNNYQLCLMKEYENGNFVPVNSQTYSIANRISYIYNLSGPSITLDTACSSSLVAAHLACESIKRGECTMAIAGGVNLSLHPSKYISLCASQFASSDGHCHSFGEDGDGYVPGEGVGAVLLRPLRDAIADRDHIYAVIKGTAVNNDGKTFGYSVPNPVAQTEVIRKALEVAHVDPRSISYVEAHGTGTKLGDPIEITGLTDAYKEYTGAKQYCAIGSVKSNIGHLEAAAGIAQISKVVLQMKHKKLVPSLLHASKLNPRIDFEHTPFFVQQKLEEWKQPTLQSNGEELVFPRRAGISSFGAGGVNAHIILEEYQGNNDHHSQGELDKHPVIIVLSAQKEQNLHVSAQRLRNFMEKSLKGPGKMARLKDIAYTLQTGRDPMSCRLAFTAREPEEIIEKVERFLNGGQALREHGLYVGYKTAETKPITVEALNAPKTVLAAPAMGETWAELWANGMEIDWESHCQDESYFKVSLPTYPFSKERYWVGEQFEKALSEPSTQAAGTKLALIQKEEDETPEEGLTFLTALCQAFTSERLGMIETHLQKMLAELLAFNPPDMPELHQGFFDIGMESVLAEQFRVLLAESFPIDFADTVVFDYPTISTLSEYIVKHIPFSELELQAFPDMAKQEKTAFLHELSMLATESVQEVETMNLEELVAGLRTLLHE